MKAVILAAGFGMVLAALPAASMAACAAPSVRINTKAALTGVLQGNTACVGTAPTFESQELHQAGGALIDYKRGGGSVDPTKQVGTWSVTGTDGRGVFVTYDYGGGNIYNYAVWRNTDGSYGFCSAKPEVKVQIRSLGGGPCP